MAALRHYLDLLSFGITTIDTLHRRVHEGQSFEAVAYAASVANGGVLEVLVTPGAVLHARFEAQIVGDASFELFENPSASGGTPVPVQNVNRMSSKVAATAVVSGPSVSDAGTRIAGPHYFPGGSGGAARGFEFGFYSERILRADMPYLARLTNQSGQARTVGLGVFWYEPNL